MSQDQESSCPRTKIQFMSIWARHQISVKSFKISTRQELSPVFSHSGQVHVQSEPFIREQVRAKSGNL